MISIEGYTTVEKVHIGVHVEVYRAISTHEKKPVILKTTRGEYPSAQELATLQHEYHLLSQLNLPGIVHAEKLLKYKNTLVLVLEDHGGQNLQHYLDGHPLELSTFFHIAEQLVDIISNLHKHNILHKDIKPSNIIIDRRTLATQLADLSISSQLSEETQDYIDLQAIEGTLAYMSPEQTGRMNRNIDYRTDLYSLGVTFFQMLTGKLPFESDDPMEMVHCHIAKKPPRIIDIIPHLPIILAQIIDKLLAKVAEDRYCSALGLKADLAECARQWRLTKSIDIFPLGQQDVYDHLQISQKLYGRSEQVINLLEAFERVRKGGRELILISGYSGIGKTSLVREIYKPILQERGYFISGKFEQLQRGTPYSAIITAFQALVNQVLVQPEEKLNAIKQELLSSLDNLGQVLIDVIPEIELIIGKQPKVTITNIPPQNLFNIVFQNFLRIFTQAGHPLVLFLDDLQWIDYASLQLLEVLLKDEDAHHFLVIGAYRDNEITSDHPLLVTLQELKAANKFTHQLILSPLIQDDIIDLLKDSLHSSSSQLTALATLLAEKTQGNPFFINMFLKTLYQENLLFFSYETGQWDWKLHAIQQQDITANVVDLLINKIHKLPIETQQILKLAACIGHVFDLNTLATIAEQSIQTTQTHLWEALQANLVKPLGTSSISSNVAALSTQVSNKIIYRFIHDRVQQAAYQLIPEENKQQTHLNIARLLYKQGLYTHEDRQLFNLLQHYNKSLHLIDNVEERLHLAQLNLQAGLKAKTSIAYQSAKMHLEAGLSLLTPQSWKNQYELTFALHREQAENEYLLGKHYEADIHFDALLQKARTRLEKAEIYSIRMILYTNLNQYDKCITMGLKGLSLFGVRYPVKPSLLSVLKTLLKTIIQLHLISWKKMRSKLVETHHPEQVALTRLVSSMQAACYNSNPNLQTLIVCNSVLISIRHGYTRFNALDYLALSMSLMVELKLRKVPKKLFDLAAELVAKLNDPVLTGMYNTLVGLLVHHWLHPLDETVHQLKQAYQLNINAGNLVFAATAKTNTTSVLYAKGFSLKEVLQAIEEALEFLTHIKDKYWLAFQTTLQQVIKGWQSGKMVNIKELIEKAENAEKATNGTIQWLYYKLCFESLFIQGDYLKAMPFAETVFKLKRFARGHVGQQDLYTLFALTFSLSCRNAPAKQQRIYYKKFKKLYREVHSWVSWCPANFTHKDLLLSAEYARLAGKNELAAELYDQAITAAQTNDFIRYVAIANECAGHFYLERGKPKFAKLYILEAYHAYQSWGCMAKTQLLEKQFPDWLQPLMLEKNTTTTMSSFDFMSTLKSTQAIASEIQLEKLLKKLLLIVLENAGAQRSVLLVNQNNQWVVEAEGTRDNQQILLTTDTDITKRDDLPLTLISYVERTQKIVLLQDNDTTVPIMLDAYVSRVQPKSLLLMPILWQGQLRRILYLENHMSVGAFTAEHLHALKLLAAQAAISLENAQLYYQASHDPLTNLANRNLLYRVFDDSAKAQANNKNFIAILFLDIDYFKMINDSLGHEVGDKLLLYIASQLKLCTQNEDLAARLGGDEFVLMLNNLEKPEQISSIVKQFYQKLKEPILIDGHEIFISSSMGISFYPTDGTDIHTLLKNADIALYQAKEIGRNNYQYYKKGLADKILKSNPTEVALQKALTDKEFKIYYQPIIDINTLQPLGLEALARWQHPTLGLLPAKDFIRLAKKTSIIIPIGEWVLVTACEQYKIWLQQGMQPIPIAINFSKLQFQMKSPSKVISAILQETQIEPQYLELELTENILFDKSQKVQHEIQALQKLGIKLVIDNFGIGYASLSNLKNLHIEKVKTHPSLLQNLFTDIESQVIIQGIMQVARTIKVTVIAKGVETPEQLGWLREQQVNAVQGYHMSVPMANDQVLDFLKSNPLKK